MKKLNFTESLRDIFTIGIKNFPAVSAATALWLLAVWIPSINIGTPIALCLLPASLAEGKPLQPLSIFEKHYRRDRSNFFLTAAKSEACVCSFKNILSKNDKNYLFFGNTSYICNH